MDGCVIILYLHQKYCLIYLFLFFFLYRGNVGVVLFNHSNEPFKVSPGDRIAQLICEKIIYPELQEVNSLDNTDRGDGGFGSTGKN